MILIVGSEGSMGKRYQAILRYLGKPFHCLDIEKAPTISDEQITGVILATPTDTHAKLIRAYLPLKKPILCEKPITKNIQELKDLFDEIRDAGVSFNMMYQYKNLISPYREGESYYNYFRHGNDGLIWDCLQIIGLSKEEPELREDSPIWKCRINGHTLSLNFMDEAYVTSVIDFLWGKPQDLGALLAAHEKTAELACR